MGLLTNNETKNARRTAERILGTRDELHRAQTRLAEKRGTSEAELGEARAHMGRVRSSELLGESAEGALDDARARVAAAEEGCEGFEDAAGELEQRLAKTDDDLLAAAGDVGQARIATATRAVEELQARATKLIAELEGVVAEAGAVRAESQLRWVTNHLRLAVEYQGSRVLRSERVTAADASSWKREFEPLTALVGRLEAEAGPVRSRREAEAKEAEANRPARPSVTVELPDGRRVDANSPEALAHSRQVLQDAQDADARERGPKSPPWSYRGRRPADGRGAVPTTPSAPAAASSVAERVAGRFSRRGASSVR